MTRGDVLAWLRSEAQRIDQLVPEAAWYLFGSALREFERACDIDVLVLCSSDEAVRIIRHELQDACARLPLHLFLLTPGEEGELGFIAAEGCVQMYPVNAIDECIGNNE